jgi:hypothetical protein
VHVTIEARKDAVAAMNPGPSGTPLHTAAVAKATLAIDSLAGFADRRGIADAMWAGYFKLSANEPHRLPKLVASIMRDFRTGDVAYALIRYNDEH